MSRRSRLVWFGSAGALIVAGAIGAAVVAGATGEILALVLISLGFVLATSLVFLEVGLSEDRERARERARAHRGPRPRTRHRPRLSRMRGSRRRL